MFKQLNHEAAQVLPALVEGVYDLQPCGHVALEGGGGEVGQLLARHEAEHRNHVGLRYVVSLEGDQLVEGRKCVAHAAFRAARDGEERVFAGLHAFALADLRQVLHDEGRRDAAQVEALAARDDGGGELVELRRCEDELHMGRRLLKRLEKGVECARREHVDFVDDEDLVARRRRGELHGFAQVADIVHACVRGGVHLDYVERCSGHDLAAVVALVAGMRGGVGRRGAVERLGEDAGECGLAYAARPHEEVGVGDALRLDGVGERLGDVLLAEDVGELLRPPFAG